METRFRDTSEMMDGPSVNFIAGACPRILSCWGPPREISASLMAIFPLLVYLRDMKYKAVVTQLEGYISKREELVTVKMSQRSNLV
jgi:hypothetical protein